MALSALSLVAVTGCEGMLQMATDQGVSPQAQAVCMSAIAQEIPGISMSMDFDAAMSRLQVNGLACVVAVVQDVMMAHVAPVPPAQAGEVLAADAEAAAAI